MLRSLEDVIDASVMATDGEIGKVRNFLFDDQSWAIRYLVVNVRSWLSRKDVVISVSAIDQPDWNAQAFRTQLTKEQVRQSPDVDSTKPVSRQQEIAMREAFGWPAYWENPNVEFPSAQAPAGRKFPVKSPDDPHLRSAENVKGYQVWAKDGEMGLLENFIVDEASWHIGYLDLKAGDWLHRRSVLVPTRWVESIDWASHRVNLQPVREQL